MARRFRWPTRIRRAAGLEGDTLGDAMRFLGMSEHEAHEWSVTACTDEPSKVGLPRTLFGPSLLPLRRHCGFAFTVILPALCFAGFWLIKVV
jgi:hypothetical protein